MAHIHFPKSGKDEWRVHVNRVHGHLRMRIDKKLSFWAWNYRDKEYWLVEVFENLGDAARNIERVTSSLPPRFVERREEANGRAA